MRLEGDLAFLTAFGADGVKQLTFARSLGSGVFSGRSASAAALRFVLETFFGVKFLLTGSEDEFLSAILADQGLVLVHFVPRKKIDTAKAVPQNFTTQQL